LKSPPWEPSAWLAAWVVKTGLPPVPVPDQFMGSVPVRSPIPGTGPRYSDFPGTPTTLFLTHSLKFENSAKFHMT